MPVADIINLDDHRKPTVRVQRTVHPGRPYRAEYRIYGSCSADVQDYIDSLVAEVEQACSGYGRFIGPHHIGHGCYVALGEVVTFTEITK